jgi:hypothetical protein
MDENRTYDLLNLTSWLLVATVTAGFMTNSLMAGMACAGFSQAWSFVLAGVTVWGLTNLAHSFLIILAFLVVSFASAIFTQD